MQAITEPPPTTAPPAYAGWYRARRALPWRKMVEGATYEQCWGQMLEALARSGQRGGDSLVARTGEDPNRGASARVRAMR